MSERLEVGGDDAGYRTGPNERTENGENHSKMDDRRWLAESAGGLSCFEWPF